MVLVIVVQQNSKSCLIRHDQHRQFVFLIWGGESTGDSLTGELNRVSIHSHFLLSENGIWVSSPSPGA